MAKQKYCISDCKFNNMDDEEGGNMVACDFCEDPEAPSSWFHNTCVGIDARKKKVDGSWICPTCIQEHKQVKKDMLTLKSEVESLRTIVSSLSSLLQVQQPVAAGENGKSFASAVASNSKSRPTPAAKMACPHYPVPKKMSSKAEPCPPKQTQDQRRRPPTAPKSAVWHTVSEYRQTCNFNLKQVFSFAERCRQQFPVLSSQG